MTNQDPLRLRLAHNRDVLIGLREPTADLPWRVLVSGCLTGLPCGVDGTDNGLGASLGSLLSRPNISVTAFCPEDFAIGTPRTMPDIHGGDGFAVLRGTAAVLDEHGTDLTAKMITGANAMLAQAREANADFAVLTDMSAACGSQVVSLGCRFDDNRVYQRGVGVAAALLLQNGIPIVSQRDFKTLALLQKRLDGDTESPTELLDHHQCEWFKDYFQN